MGTLKGFPTPPALWRWRAKPALANAINQDDLKLGVAGCGVPEGVGTS